MYKDAMQLSEMCPCKRNLSNLINLLQSLRCTQIKLNSIIENKTQMGFFAPMSIKTSPGGVVTFMSDFPVEFAKIEGKILSFFLSSSWPFQMLRQHF